MTSVASTRSDNATGRAEPAAGWSRYRPLAVLGGLYLLGGLSLRLVLWWAFGRPSQVPYGAVPEIFARGFAADLVELVYLLLPLTVYLSLLSQRPLARPRRHLLFLLGSYLALFALLFLTATEFFFFDEYNARFNLVAVDYLIYPTEVFINIWQSYPVVLVTACVALLAAVVLAALWRPMTHGLRRPVSGRRRGAVVAAHCCLLALAAAGFSTDTLAYRGNRVATELSTNGLSSFFRALRTNELDYQANYLAGDSQQMFRLLAEDLDATAGGQFTRLGQGRLDRTFAADSAGLGALNVVVVLEESLGAEFSGAYGAAQSLTPRLDALAGRSLTFTHAYATGTRTVRGIEAVITSLPPIPSESVVKRPGSEGMSNWGAVMHEHGYRTSFLYGGYSYFDNMGHFFGENGFAVSDRQDVESPLFANIWGVSDQDLFDHALAYFDREAASGAPFFSVVLTTSNHKPFTFPGGVPGVPEEGGGRAAGVRYADFALGEFLDKAADHEWFADTLFVVLGDHGARVYGAAEIPLHSYEIPILVYSPAHVAAKEVSVPTSQIDVAPTVLGLLGFSYEAPFFGENVLACGACDGRTLLFNHNHDVALLRGDELVVLGLQRSESTYRYIAQRDRLVPQPDDRRLADLTVAYYQTAADLFRRGLY